MKNYKIYIALFCVLLFVPLGLISENPAWGEWSGEEFEAMVGFVPHSIATSTSLISPILPDYSLESIGSVASYYLSAILGAFICMGAIWLIKPKNRNQKM